MKKNFLKARNTVLRMTVVLQKELHFAPHTISDACLCILAASCPNLEV